MPKLTAPSVATLTITTPGQSVAVTCGAGERMQVDWEGPGGSSGSRLVLNETLDVGPFVDNTVVTFRALSGSPSYDGGIFAEVKTNPLNGEVAIQSGGVSYPLTSEQETYQLPPATTRITASQAVVGKAVKLTSIKCIAGAAIALTVYDNGTTNAGSVLFTQTMSAGDEALIPSGIQAINGLYASFTGTATFDIGAQDAV